MGALKKTLIDCPDCMGDDEFCDQCEGLGYVQCELSLCKWCNQYDTFVGWHKCEQAQNGRNQLNGLVEDLHAIGRGEQINHPMTSLQVRERSDRLRNMATGVKITGGNVREEYR